MQTPNSFTMQNDLCNPRGSHNYTAPLVDQQEESPMVRFLRSKMLDNNSNHSSSSVPAFTPTTAKASCWADDDDLMDFVQTHRPSEVAGYRYVPNDEFMPSSAQRSTSQPIQAKQFCNFNNTAERQLPRYGEEDNIPVGPFTMEDANDVPNSSYGGGSATYTCAVAAAHVRDIMEPLDWRATPHHNFAQKQIPTLQRQTRRASIESIEYTTSIIGQALSVHYDHDDVFCEDDDDVFCDNQDEEILNESYASIDEMEERLSSCMDRSEHTRELLHQLQAQSKAQSRVQSQAQVQRKDWSYDGHYQY